jgi:hypothetical protein
LIRQAGAAPWFPGKRRSARECVAKEDYGIRWLRRPQLSFYQIVQQGKTEASFGPASGRNSPSSPECWNLVGSLVSLWSEQSKWETDFYHALLG